ncbi:MAG: Crp/Fnr family transcriptional regulator [Bacteroidales bacterium]|nr:Crp/Fnr family transcriptional regulator [Bacteroidales bacterium]
MEKNRLEINYKEDETICKQGTFASHIIYICKGLVKIYVEDDAGSLILKILPKGNLIGLSALYDGNNIFPYSATAYQDTKARLIDIHVFRKLLKSNAEFASEIINVMCENSIQTFGRFFSLTQKQSYGKLADIILCLSDRIFKKNEFDLDLTRKELAELTGMSTERVIRMLKKFKDDKLIAINKKTFKILDEEKLQHISQYG